MRDENGLTVKQARFVHEYRKDMNATQAALRAGYNPHTADKQGPRLLTNVVIGRILAQETKKALDEVGVDANRVLREISRLAFSDVRSLFDESGNLKPLHTLTDSEAAAIAGCEVIIKNAEAGDGKTDRVHKIKVWDKPKNLEMLAKHFKLLTDVIEHRGDGLGERLKGARKRIA